MSKHDATSALPALAEVLPQDQKPWHKIPHLLKLNTLLAGMLIFSSTVGYDTSLMNGLQSLTEWTKFMDKPSGAWLGFIGTVQSIGGLIGLPLQAWCCNKYGRKSGLWVGYFFIVLGVAMQTAAPNPALWILARFFIGHSSAWFQSAAILVTEVAYPNHRSKLVALYHSMYYVGSVLSAWVTFGCQSMASSWGWRIPVLLQIALPLISLPAALLTPESPRWLIRNDRTDEARRIIVDHHAGGDEQAPLVGFQIEEIEEAIRWEEELAGTTSWIDMLKTKGNRRRFYISVTLGISSQWNGVGVISYYLNLILNTIGITSSHDQTLINGCLQVWNLVLATIGSLLVDFAGRRRLLLISTAVMLLSYIIITGLSRSFATSHLSSVGTAVIPFLFIYYGGYDIAWTPLLIAYPVEIWTYSFRAKGLALTYMCTYGALIFNQFVNPIAMDAIGWKYYILYIVLLAIMVVNVYLMYPETRGYSLEQVAVIFDEDCEGSGTQGQAGVGLKTLASPEAEHVEDVPRKSDEDGKK